jgi:hypothetical protein
MKMWFASSLEEASLSVRGLVDVLVAPWPQRHQKLLVVGTDPGIVCHQLCSRGFAVTLAAPTPTFLAQTRERCPSVDLHLAQPDHLPWEDGSFDFAISLFAWQEAEMPRCLRELIRVVQGGVVVIFGDAWAIGRLAQSTPPVSAPWWKVRAALRRCAPGHTRSASVFFGKTQMFGRTLLLPPGIGPCCGIRHWLAAPQYVTTPLWAWREREPMSYSS